MRVHLARLLRAGERPSGSRSMHIAAGSQLNIVDAFPSSHWTSSAAKPMIDGDYIVTQLPPMRPIPRMHDTRPDYSLLTRAVRLVPTVQATGLPKSPGSVYYISHDTSKLGQMYRSSTFETDESISGHMLFYLLMLSTIQMEAEQTVVTAKCMSVCLSPDATT